MLIITSHHDLNTEFPRPEDPQDTHPAWNTYYRHLHPSSSSSIFFSFFSPLKSPLLLHLLFSSCSIPPPPPLSLPSPSYHFGLVIRLQPSPCSRSRPLVSFPSLSSFSSSQSCLFLLLFLLLSLLIHLIPVLVLFLPPPPRGTFPIPSAPGISHTILKALSRVFIPFS